MRRRRAIGVFISAGIVVALLLSALVQLVQQQGGGVSLFDTIVPAQQEQAQDSGGSVSGAAYEALQTLEVKGRAPKTGYERAQFGDGWSVSYGCSTRNIILNRDLTNVVVDDECRVISGTLQDPYTGEMISFSNANASAVQIDHVVALSDAWQKGAQLLSPETREELANDPLELLAVDGPANQQKGDGDAATWLPKNKAYRCEYVARQIAVKQKYTLWVTSAEKDAMERVLEGCPNQALPTQ